MKPLCDETAVLASVRRLESPTLPQQLARGARHCRFLHPTPPQSEEAAHDHQEDGDELRPGQGASQEMLSPPFRWPALTTVYRDDEIPSRNDVLI